MRRDSAAFAILVGGGIAGALDILYAITFSILVRGSTAMNLLQFVASGLIGSAAYEGGASTAALGLLLHFALALLFAAVFYFASLRIAFLTRHPVYSGVFYGVLVFAVMNFIVLPLSAFGDQFVFAPFASRISLLANTTNLLSHMFLFGVPIALAARAAIHASPARVAPAL